MTPRYVIADGLGVCYWLGHDPKYWTADIVKARKFISEHEARTVAKYSGVQNYTIQSLPACQEKARA